MIPWLESFTPFPEPCFALPRGSYAPGLLAAGGNLSTTRLLTAYRKGIFPWFSEDQPILWWSPDPRMVLHTDRFKISVSLKKKLKQIKLSMDLQGAWQIRFDSAFETVIRACAAPRKEIASTWISEEMIRAYCHLHHQGFAHSSELWYETKIVAGVYGIAIGRMFYGESMFSRVSDGSKIALAYLVYFLRENNVSLIDCQQETPHLASLGACPITRENFLTNMNQAVSKPAITNWDASAIKFSFGA